MIINANNQNYSTKFGILQTQITGRCNMRCQHCRAWELPKTDLPPSTFQTVLDFANQEKSADFHITLSGGEPFLHPNILEFIEISEKSNPNSFSITTNGSILNKDILYRIKQSKFKKYLIQISLDSPIPKKHDDFRNTQNAWQNAITLMNFLKTENMPFAIRMTVTPNNISNIDQMVTLAKQLGAIRLSMDPVIPAGKGTDEKLWLNPKQKKAFLEKVIKLKIEQNGKIEILSECPQKLCIPESPYLTEQIDLNNQALFGGCTAGVTQISLENDGRITPCALLPKTIINATGKTPAQIVSAYKKSKLIKEFILRKFKGTCGKCKYTRLCGGCRANAYFNGNYLGSDESCWIKEESK
jgi:AdoMet-dependent heme synthase